MTDDIEILARIEDGNGAGRNPLPDLTHNPLNSLIVRQYMVRDLSARGHALSLDSFNPNSNANSDDEDQRDGPRSNPLADRISRALEQLTEEMRSRGFTVELAAVADRADLSEEYLGSSLEVLSNELFAQGVKWSHIATYFAFCGELAHQFLTSGRNHLIGPLSVAMNSFIEARLALWIGEHGGWDGIVDYANGFSAAAGESSTDFMSWLNRNLSHTLVCGLTAGLGVIALGLLVLIKH